MMNLGNLSQIKMKSMKEKKEEEEGVEVEVKVKVEGSTKVWIGKFQH